MKHWRDLELKTGLSFQERNGSLLIKPRFLLNRFNIGGLVLFVAGNCFAWIAVWKTYNAFDFYLMVGFGVILMIAGVLVTIKTLTDFLLVTDTELVFRNSLKTRQLKLEPGLKVKVKVKKSRSKTRGWYKSSIDVDIYIKKGGNKHRIIDFLSERVDRKSAMIVGETISNYITKKIEALP